MPARDHALAATTALDAWNVAFNRGDAQTLLRFGERLFDSGRDNRFVHAMYAFGLVENHRLDEAEVLMDDTEPVPGVDRAFVRGDDAAPQKGPAR
mgnify:CR=1 FL=1